MYPNIKDGDLVVYYRLDKNYTARDLTVLDYQGSRQVRRVIAVAGDTVDITEDGLLVNGSPQQEPGIYEKQKDMRKAWISLLHSRTEKYLSWVTPGKMPRTAGFTVLSE